METNNYTFEEIENYLAGNLTENDKDKFEKDLKKNPSLAIEVKKHQDTNRLVHLYAKEHVKSNIKGIHAKMKNREGASSTATGFPLMKIAASIALLIVVGTMYFYMANSYSANSLAESAFTPYPNRNNTMGDTAQDSFAEGLRSYDGENYEKAISHFEEIPVTDKNYQASLFYSGVSYFIIDQPTRAIEYFTKVSQENTLYTDAAQWYLSLAYLKAQQNEKAIELLQEIVNNEGYQFNKAKEILDKMNSPIRKLPFVK